jgi:glycosyltransferase involved in cell wall biosynthesis
MIRVAGRPSEAEISDLRAELGFKRNDFIVATFGHVVWTKLGDRLLDAFLDSELSRDSSCHLIFVGELAVDDFGIKLKDAIRKSGLRNRIKITGYLSEEDYQRYLRIADVAVQLRTKSRGGTPRGVLDCLACGLPVVVNNEASYEDYPDDVVAKLPPNPLPGDIAGALLGLRKSVSERRKLSDRGLNYVRKHHDPEMLAAQYAGAIYEFMALSKARSAQYFVEKVAPHLAALTDSNASVKLASSYFEARLAPSFARPRLVVDVSHIAQADHETGIQRVVKETVRALYCGKRTDIEALAVERLEDHIVPALGWLDQQRLLMPYETDASMRLPVHFRAGDHLLMLDSSWASYDQFAPAFAAARAKRVPIVTAIYDLLPINLPPGNFVEGGKEWFEGWLRRAIAASDGLVCISKAVADELIGFIEQHQLDRPGLKVGWWHLGSTPPTVEQPSSLSLVRNAALVPYCLMVGTIEPRKNHAMALDAFERLWAAGSDLKLVIAGKPGWMVDGLMARLRSHRELNKRLFLFEKINDAEIAHLYQNSAMLLFISKGEGFGLPLVEAAHHGKPLVCSRIPSFLEIAGEQAIYVTTDSATKLADELALAWHLCKSGKAPDSRTMPRLTWEESTDALLSVVVDENWYWPR